MAYRLDWAIAPSFVSVVAKIVDYKYVRGQKLCIYTTFFQSAHATDFTISHVETNKSGRVHKSRRVQYHREV